MQNKNTKGALKRIFDYCKGALKRNRSILDLNPDNVCRLDLKFGQGILTLFVVVPEEAPPTFGKANDWAEFIRVSVAKNVQFLLTRNQIEFERTNENFDSLIQALHKDNVPVH